MLGKFFLKPPNEIFYRIINLLLSSFIFTNLIPVMMFVIYMRQNTIFSYDFFFSGLFGLKVFFFYSIPILIIFIFFMTSSMIFIIGAYVDIMKKTHKKNYFFAALKRSFKFRRKKSINEIEIYIFALLSFILNITIVISFSIYLGENSQEVSIKQYFFYILSLSFVMSIHYGNTFYKKAESALISLIMSSAIIIGILLYYSELTAGMIKYGLQSFGSASKEVVVKHIKEKNEIIEEGELILLSPENIFIFVNETNRTIIIKRDNLIIDIKN